MSLEGCLIQFTFQR